MSTFLSADQATEILGISKTTLYAYVSRGLVRSETIEQSRKRKYRAEDIYYLKERKALKAAPEQALKQSLYWGSPLMDSAISLIQDSALYYRGKPIEDLMRSHSFLSFAPWLWESSKSSFTGDLGVELPMDLLKEQGIYTRMQLTMSLAASQDIHAWDLSQQGIQATATRLVRLLLQALSVSPEPPEDLGPLVSHLNLPKEGESLLNTLLILSADHELNISTFTARCVSSAGSTPYESIQGGLSALKGFRHGGSIEPIMDFIQAYIQSKQPENHLRKCLRQGQGLPGFGHRLYPDGDPRWTCFMEALSAYDFDSAEFRSIQTLIQKGSELSHSLPRIDLAWAIFGILFDLDFETCLSLFALGRSSGWLAHILEQAQDQQLIRPRARYNGPTPEFKEND